MARKLTGIKPEQGSDEIKGRVANGIHPCGEVIEHSTSKKNVRHTESKGDEQNRKEQVGPAFTRALVIEDEHHKYTQPDTGIGYNKEKLPQEFVQADM